MTLGAIPSWTSNNRWVQLKISNFLLGILRWMRLPLSSQRMMQIVCWEIWPIGEVVNTLGFHPRIRRFEPVMGHQIGSVV